MRATRLTKAPLHCLAYCSVCSALFALAPMGSSHAEATITTSATAQYQNNSNVFQLESGFAAPGIDGSDHGDSFYAYGGSFELDEMLRRQKFFVALTGTEFRYDRFTILDHSEYNLDGGLNWALGSEFDGKLEVSRVRAMIAFVDLTPAAQSRIQLPVQTEQRETAQIGYLFNPNFRFESTGFYRIVDAPLIDTPNLKLKETSGLVALKFLGRAAVTSGVSAGYLSGDYTGGTIAANPSYQQSNVDLTANYQVSGRSSWTGEIGYSRRKSSTGSNDVSGVTGQLNFRDQLTGKSSVDVLLSRAINSYIANTGSEIDSIATLSLNWQATYKLGVAAGYTFTNRDLPNQGNAPATDRTDHLEFASLKIDYEPYRWLVIKPYVNVQTRKSDLVGANFNETVYGIYVTIQLVK